MYYDHNLTQIKKGELIHQADPITNQGRQLTHLSDHKDTRLFSILQITLQKF